MPHHSEKVLYRYYPGALRDIESITEGYLWFSSLDKMNDAFEGVHSISLEGLDDAAIRSITRRALIREGKSPAAAERLIKIKLKNSIDSKEQKKLIKEVIVNSYKRAYQTIIARGYCCMIGRNDKQHEDVTDSELLLMWGHYGKGLTGFRVEFDYNLLLKNLQKKYSLDPYPVTYSLKPPTVKLSQLFSELHLVDQPYSPEVTDILKACLTTKHSAWSYEREVRLCAKSPGKIYFDHSCIKEIVIGGKMDAIQKNKLISKIRNIHPHIRIKIAKIAENAYVIETADI